MLASRAWARAQLGRYWTDCEELIADLLVFQAFSPEHDPLPPELAWIELPKWASEWGDEGTRMRGTPSRVPLMPLPNPRKRTIT